jgi:hypothetical protein
MLSIHIFEMFYQKNQEISGFRDKSLAKSLGSEVELIFWLIIYLENGWSSGPGNIIYWIYCRCICSIYSIRRTKGPAVIEINH